MGYLYLILSVLCGNIKGFCGKKTSALTKELHDAVMFNSIRMLLCILTGFFVVAIQNGFSGFKADASVILITLVAGIMNSVFVVSWLIAVKYGMYMTVDVSLTFGMAVPIILSCLFFNESVSVKQIIGLLLLVTAVYIMCSYNAQQKGKAQAKTYIVLFVCGLANGLCDFSQKLFVNSGTGLSISAYNFYTYVFSAATLIIFSLIFNKEKSKADYKGAGIYLVIMAICLFGYSYFKTKSAVFLPSVQLYPLSQSLSMILSAVMASVFFKEKITPKCIFGITLSFAALLFINM